MVSDQFYFFLTQFFKLHSNYISIPIGTNIKTSRNFYLSGESHAGHYIPYMSDYILKKNKQISSNGKVDNIIINLKGIALGNPWIDPYYQYDAADFVHGHGLVSTGMCVYHTMYHMI